jgi:hypothetical protein
MSTDTVANELFAVSIEVEIVGRSEKRHAYWAPDLIKVPVEQVMALASLLLSWQTATVEQLTQNKALIDARYSQ